MSRPITWQNVSGPDPVLALRPLESAQRSMNSVFDNFNGVIKDRQAQEAAAYQKLVKDNTENALSGIFAIGSADEFQKMQQSGQLQKMVGANGSFVDKTAVRSALDGRLATLQGRDKQAWESANAQLDQQEAPAINQIKALLAKGDLAGTKPLIAGLSARGQANTLSLADARERELLLRTRGDKEFGWKEGDEAHKVALRPGQLAQQEMALKQAAAGIKASEAQTEASRASTRLTNYTIGKNQGEGAKAQARAKIANELKDNWYAEGPASATDLPELSELIQKNNIGDSRREQSYLVERINKLVQEGVAVQVTKDDGAVDVVRIPVPLSMMKANLLSLRDERLNVTPWQWNEGWANNLEETIKAAMQKNSGQIGNVKNQAAENYREYRRILEEEAQNSPGAASKGRGK